MTTLISMIGKGIPEANEVRSYQKVTYCFACGKMVKTSCSTNAILASRLYPIDKVVVIGTTTSSWGELLEDSPEEFNLFSQLFDDCEKGVPFDVNGDFSKQMKDLLQKRWNVQNVSFVATPAELTSETAKNIYDEYIRKCQGAERDFILDVTHGLRWMPMFLTSAIRYKEMVEHGLDSMRLLYAEIPPGKNPDKTGSIRELDMLWHGQKTAEAMRLLIDKFDSAELLLQMNFQLPPDSCTKLKEAMEIFGNSMQADYLMPLVWDRNDTSDGYPLGKYVKQLRNGIKEVGKLEEKACCPSWLSRVAGEMKDWVDRLQKSDYPSERLLELADMYAERKLWGQAMLALDVALRIFACERYQPRHYPCWEDTDKNLKSLKNDLKSRAIIDLSQKDIDAVFDLTHTRNMVAHGTLTSPDDPQNTPERPNLAKDYNRFKMVLIKLFTCRN